MQKYAEHVLVRSRWLLCNKGDYANPDCRARLVACEVNKNNTHEAAFHASTPPLEAKKLLFHKYASAPNVEGTPQRLSFVDIRKAYFNSTTRRNLFMSFPRELGLPSNLIARQVKCVYGTRDAGAIWEDVYRDVLEDIGFRSGAASPC